MGGEASLANRLGVPPVRLGPLEALARGVITGPGDLVFCLDWLAEADGVQVGPPPLKPGEAAGLTHELAEQCRDLPGFRWHALPGRRQVLIYDGGWPFDLHTHRPAALLGKLLANHEPWGSGDEVIRTIHDRSQNVGSPGIRAWLWGEGPHQPPHPLGKGVIVSSDLWPRGLAKHIRLHALDVPPTADPAALGRAAAQMLGRYDRVIVHATLDEPTVTAELLPIIQAAVEDHGGYELIVS